MRKLLITTSLALILAACGGGNDGNKKTTLDNVKEKAGEVSDTTKETTSDIADAAGDVSEDAQNIASDAANDLADSASDAAKAADAMASDAKDAADNMLNDAKGAADDMVNGAKDAAGDLKDSAEAKVEEAKAAFDVSALPAAYQDADLEKGQGVYRQCASCHLVDDSGKHRVGPNLHGVIGREAGTTEGFNYSKAMKESGIVWTAETINEYIENPRAYIPGNRMSFAGLRKPEDRVNVIAYLMVEGGQTAE